MVRLHHSDNFIQQKTMNRGFGDIRMTNAQLGMNRSIREKWIELPPAPSVNSFKLKRFTTDVEPKVSTKRGQQPYMIKSSAKQVPTETH